MDRPNSSTVIITDAVMMLFDRIIDPSLLVRRINLTAANVRPEVAAERNSCFEQLDLFADVQQRETERIALEREKRRQQAVLKIKKRFGKNAIVKGMNLEDGATAMDRNRQIGGHKA